MPSLGTMEYAEQAALVFTNRECLDKYVQGDLFDPDCAKGLLSKLLGYGVVAGSVIIKVPQITKMMSNGSSQGISFVSQLADVIAITCNMSYSYVSGFPFSTWGDTVFNFLQTLCIATLCLMYTGRGILGFVFAALVLMITAFMTSGSVELQFLGLLNGFNIPLLLISRGTQIWTNFSNGSTGQLSFVTTLLLFGGALARVFTSVQETGDWNLISIFATAAVLNGTVVLQVLYYWNVKVRTD